MTNDTVIRAAGGVVCMQTPAGFELLLVHRKRYGDWTLPKGKLKDEESFAAAAIREVQEETGYRVELGHYLGSIGYSAGDSPKVVLFWRMSPSEKIGNPDPEEVAETVWLPVAEAARKLTHPEEVRLITRIFTVFRPYESPKPLGEELKRWELGWVWWKGQRTFARLLREFEAFRVELAFQEQRTDNGDRGWAEAARDQLEAVMRNLKKKRDIEGGWYCLHSARRLAVFGLHAAELADLSHVLREEAQKLSPWRRKAIEKLLNVPDDRVTPSQVAKAMELRDEYAANQYHKIWLLADQLRILIVMSLITVFALLMCLAIGGQPGESWTWKTVADVLLVGILGAAFSAAQSLISNTSDTPIPERVANYWVTIGRAVFGAVAGLAGFLFLKSQLVSIRIGDEGQRFAADLAIGFVFGYTGQVLVARVADSFGKDSRGNKP